MDIEDKKSVKYYEDQIKKIENEIYEVFRRGDVFVSEFPKILMDYVPATINKRVIVLIENNYGVFNSLSKEVIAQMKLDIMGNIQSSLNKINSLVDNKIVWARRCPKKEGEDEEQFWRRTLLATEDGILEVLNLLLASTLEPLVKVGIVKFNGQWENSQRASDGLPNFRFPGLLLPKDIQIKKFFREYSDLINEYHRLRVQFAINHNAKDIAEARELWEDT